jgi:CRISPR-associated protein Csx10
MIIPGTHGGPSLDVQAALQGVLGDQISVVAAWVRPVRVYGWHMASGLPKPEEWACAAGSTAVIEGAPDDLVQRLVGGVGLRRREGFGELFVVDEPTPVMAERVEEQREPTAEEFARLADHINLGPRSQVQDGGSAADDAAEPHADRDWDEQSTEPEPSRERERKVDDALAAVAVQPNTSQRSIVNGLVNAITRMRRIREAGSPEANARLALSDFLGRPSMRALPAAVVQLIKELLSDPDTANLAELRDAVERQAKLRGML